MRFQPFNFLLIARDLTGILAKPTLLLTQHGFKQLNIVGEFIVHSLVLSWVISGCQAVLSVWDVATRSPPVAWITELASGALSLPGSPTRRSGPVPGVWRTGITRHDRPTVFI